jgi:hypothetical protein
MPRQVGLNTNGGQGAPLRSFGQCRFYSVDTEIPKSRRGEQFKVTGNFAIRFSISVVFLARFNKRFNALCWDIVDCYRRAAASRALLNLMNFRRTSSVGFVQKMNVDTI